jgi:hypothetical protein
MFKEIMLIISALILLANMMNGIPAIGKSLEKLGKWLAGAGVLVGILDIIALFV